MPTWTRRSAGPPPAPSPGTCPARRSATSHAGRRVAPPGRRSVALPRDDPPAVRLAHGFGDHGETHRARATRPRRIDCGSTAGVDQRCARRNDASRRARERIISRRVANHSPPLLRPDIPKTSERPLENRHKRESVAESDGPLPPVTDIVRNKCAFQQTTVATASVFQRTDIPTISRSLQPFCSTSTALHKRVMPLKLKRTFTRRWI